MDLSKGLLPYAALFRDRCDQKERGEEVEVEADDEFEAALFFGEGISEDVWLGLLCVCSEASFGSEMAVALLGDLAYRSFTDDPIRTSRLEAARKVFPGVAMINEYMNWYVATFNDGDKPPQ